MPGHPYAGPHPGSYYLSNIVVESDHILQVFSGKLDNPGHTNGLITDFYNDRNTNGQPSLKGTPANNVPYDGLNYNMGGCMGCHGNIAESKVSALVRVVAFISPRPKVAEPTNRPVT